MAQAHSARRVFKPVVCELGAGCGLVGMTFALHGAAHVVLTDLEAVVPHLQENVAANFEQHGETWVVRSSLNGEDLTVVLNAVLTRGAQIRMRLASSQLAAVQTSTFWWLPMPFISRSRSSPSSPRCELLRRSRPSFFWPSRSGAQMSGKPSTTDSGKALSAVCEQGSSRLRWARAPTWSGCRFYSVNARAPIRTPWTCSPIPLPISKTLSLHRNLAKVG